VSEKEDSDKEDVESNDAETPTDERQTPHQSRDAGSASDDIDMEEEAESRAIQKEQPMEQDPPEVLATSEMPTDSTANATADEEMQSETEGRARIRPYFPKVSQWLQKREPEKADRLKDLGQAYRKAWNSRRMRTQRGKPTDDVEKQCAKLLQQAWLLVESP
jgi:hypothetical protein